MTIAVATKEPITEEELGYLKQAFAGDTPDKELLAEKFRDYNNVVTDHSGNPLVLLCSPLDLQDNKAHWGHIEV